MKLHKIEGQSYHYSGVLSYTLLYDHHAGRRRRYTVMVMTDDDPVIIGRELDMVTAKGLIAEYEQDAKKLEDAGFYGGHCIELVRLLRDVICKRRKERYGF